MLRDGLKSGMGEWWKGGVGLEGSGGTTKIHEIHNCKSPDLSAKAPHRLDRVLRLDARIIPKPAADVQGGAGASHGNVNEDKFC